MKKPFNIGYRQKIEDGEYRLQTRDGRAVRIVCWDMKAPAQLIGCVARNEEGDEQHLLWYADGIHKRDANYKPVETQDDLFVVTSEPELTRLEQAVAVALEDFSSGKNRLPVIDAARKYAGAIMDAAREEIEDNGRLVWRRIPLNGVYYPADAWSLASVTTEKGELVEALTKGNYYVPLRDIDAITGVPGDATAGRYTTVLNDKTYAGNLTVFEELLRNVVNMFLKQDGTPPMTDGEAREYGANLFTEARVEIASEINVEDMTSRIGYVNSVYNGDQMKQAYTNGLRDAREKVLKGVS